MERARVAAVAAGAVLADDIDLVLVPELWSLAARAILQSRTRCVLNGHGGAVTAASFSADGRRIVTDSEDGAARVWDAETGDQTAVFQAREGTMHAAVLSPDSRRIVTRWSDNR